MSYSTGHGKWRPPFGDRLQGWGYRATVAAARGVGCVGAWSGSGGGGRPGCGGHGAVAGDVRSGGTDIRRTSRLGRPGYGRGDLSGSATCHDLTAREPVRSPPVRSMLLRLVDTPSDLRFPLAGVGQNMRGIGPDRSAARDSSSTSISSIAASRTSGTGPSQGPARSTAVAPRAMASTTICATFAACPQLLGVGPVRAYAQCLPGRLGGHERQPAHDQQQRDAE